MTSPVNYTDPTGHYPEWLEVLMGYTKIHNEVIAHFINNYLDGLGIPDYYIPGGGRNGGKGYADIYDPLGPSIYEVKIKSMAKTNAKYINKGREQLDRYAKTEHCSKGDMVVPETEFKSTYRGNDVTVKYYSDGDGMILYEIVPGKKEKQTQRSKVETKDIVGAAAIGTLIVSAFGRFVERLAGLPFFYIPEKYYKPEEDRTLRNKATLT